MAPFSEAARTPVRAGRALAVVLALQLLAPFTPAAANTVTMAQLDCNILRGVTGWALPIKLGTCNPPPQCNREDPKGWRNSRKNGIFCNAAGRVSALALKGRASGPLPELLGLNGLRALVIPGAGNRRSTGSVPVSWRFLPLTDLDLGDNPGLTGPIPNEVLARKSLRYVRVAYSGIRGNVAFFSRKGIPGARMTLVVSGFNAGETSEICGFPDETIVLRAMFRGDRKLYKVAIPACGGTLVGFIPPSGWPPVGRRLRAGVHAPRV